MFTYTRKAGTTDVSVILRVIDSTDGTPEAAFAYNTTGIDLVYRREGATVTDITEATLAGADAAHSDGGVIYLHDGYIRVDLPDAACASGVTGVLVSGSATGMVIIGCYVELVAYDPFDTVRLGMTALPNAAADAAGGLPISDAGALDLDTKLAATNEVTAARMGALTDLINGGRLDLLIDAIKAATDLVTAARMGALTDLIDGGRLDLILDGILTDTGTTLDGRIPAALVSGRMDVSVGAMAAGVVTAAAIATGAIDADAIADNAIDAGAIAADAITAAKIADGAIDAATFAAGAINAAAIANGAIDNATFAADVGSTAHATNIISLAARKGLDDYDPPTKAELDTAVANVSVDEIQATAIADLFNTDSATDYASAVAGSAVKEIADNAGGSALTAGGIADAVWDETIADHAGVGSTGAALAAAGGSGDPWATALPGAYGAGTAGKLIGDNINAPIGTVDTVVDAIKAKTDNLPADPADDSDIDTQLAAIAGYLDTEVAAILAAVDTEVAAIKAKTDNLPADPADDSDIDTQLAAIAGYLDTEVAAILAAVDTEVAAIKAKTDNLPTDPADESLIIAATDAIKADTAAILVDTGTDGVVLKAAGLAADAVAEIADGVFDEAMAGHVAAGSAGKALADILEDTGTTLQAEVDGIQTDTEDIQTKIGAPAGASLAADIAAIEAQTDDIGAAGAGLSAVPWNAAWDAEVQSEVDDALGAAITEPTAISDTKSVKFFLWSIFSRFFHKNTQTATEQKTFKADGSTALATRTVSDDSTTQTLGAGS